MKLINHHDIEAFKQRDPELQENVKHGNPKPKRDSRNPITDAIEEMFEYYRGVSR